MKYKPLLYNNNDLPDTQTNTTWKHNLKKTLSSNRKAAQKAAMEKQKEKQKEKRDSWKEPNEAMTADGENQEPDPNSPDSDPMGQTPESYQTRDQGMPPNLTVAVTRTLSLY